MITQRFGITSGKPITNDFPVRSRTALAHVFHDLSDRQFILEKEILQELNRLGRYTSNDFDEVKGKIFLSNIYIRLQKLRWFDVMNFCERVYEKYLHSVGDGFVETYISVEEAQLYFSKEINQILIEDNLAFSFENGKFQRRGRPQTQKAIERAGAVLSDPALDKVKRHFIKAIRFFNIRPEADVENCVKEALCALEACVEILTGKKASSDFDKAISQLIGNDPRKIPPPIAESMKKIFGYRGSGEGVAHAALQGNRVSPIEAELVLSLVASYITYLVDLFPSEEDIPF